MNVSTVLRKDYENVRLRTRRKNKAKQTQFAGRSNERNLIYNKGLRKYSSPRTPQKQSQTKPNQTQFQLCPKVSKIF